MSSKRNALALASFRSSLSDPMAGACAPAPLQRSTKPKRSLARLRPAYFRPCPENARELFQSPPCCVTSLCRACLWRPKKSLPHFESPSPALDLRRACQEERDNNNIPAPPARHDQVVRARYYRIGISCKFLCSSSERCWRVFGRRKGRRLGGHCRTTGRVRDGITTSATAACGQGDKQEMAQLLRTMIMAMDEAEATEACKALYAFVKTMKKDQPKDVCDSFDTTLEHWCKKNYSFARSYQVEPSRRDGMTSEAEIWFGKNSNLGIISMTPVERVKRFFVYQDELEAELGAMLQSNGPSTRSDGFAATRLQAARNAAQRFVVHIRLSKRS